MKSLDVNGSISLPRDIQLSIKEKHLTDLRVANTDGEKEIIFRFRYDAYLREKTVVANDTGILTDVFDHSDNCYIIGLYLKDILVSTVRIHVISADNPIGPAMKHFPESVEPMLSKGMVIIDPTRLATSSDASSRHKVLPYLTMKAACMAARYFKADVCLATVRKEHMGFYTKVIQAVSLGDSRSISGMVYPSNLMATDISKSWEPVMKKYPIFTSTEEEREKVFGQN